MDTLQARFNAQARAIKFKLFEELAQQTEVFAFINLDTEGVRVPDHLRQVPDRALILKFSPRYESRLELLPEGVAQLLRFQGQDFPVFVAWDAIFQLADNDLKPTKMCAWPWFAPKTLKQLTQNVLIELDGLEVVVEPSGQVREPVRTH